jgi:hypothetical protein
MADPAAVSVTAEEREAVIDQIRKTYVHDQTDVQGFERRLGAALAAATPPELLALVAGSDTPRWMKTFGPGRRGFAHRRFQQCHRFQSEIGELFRELVLHVVPQLVAGGYHVAQCNEPTLIVLERRRPSLFGHPIGYPSPLEIWLEPIASETLLVARGNAPAHVRQALWQLTKPRPLDREQ